MRTVLRAIPKVQNYVQLKENANAVLCCVIRLRGGLYPRAAGICAALPDAEKLDQIRGDIKNQVTFPTPSSAKIEC